MSSSEFQGTAWRKRVEWDWMMMLLLASWEGCDRLCSITSNWSLTTEDQGMSVLMPEEVWQLRAASHLLLLFSSALVVSHIVLYEFPFFLNMPVISISFSQLMVVKGHWLLGHAGKMAKDRLIVAVWVTLEVFGSLSTQSPTWRCFPSSKTNAAKSLISISQQFDARWNYSGVMIHWLQPGWTEAWCTDRNINKSHLFLWWSLSWFA